MAYVIKTDTSVFVREEVTEGTYLAPSAASEAVEVLEDGYESTYTRETIANTALTGSIEPIATRIGLPKIGGTIKVYNRAAVKGSVGGAPPSDLFFKSLLGGKRQITAQVTTKNAGNTTTSLKIEDADIAKFKVGDIIKVNLAGKHELRPISAVDSTGGAAAITLPFALENNPGNSVVIEKATTYYYANTPSSLSITEFPGGVIQNKIGGAKIVSGALGNWETGKVSDWSFKYDALNYDRIVDTPDYAGNFSTLAAPPVTLSACVWIGGTKFAYNAFNLNIENTAPAIKSACAASGLLAHRYTELKVTGEINPYMESDDVDRYTLFNNNTATSLFGYAYNNDTSAGEFKEATAFWLPAITITEMPMGDLDKVLTDAIKFSAQKTSGNDTIFLGFI
jgi:hypothetical protein